MKVKVHTEMWNKEREIERNLENKKRSKPISQIPSETFKLKKEFKF